MIDYSLFAPAISMFARRQLSAASKPEKLHCICIALAFASNATDYQIRGMQAACTADTRKSLEHPQIYCSNGDEHRITIRITMQFLALGSRCSVSRILNDFEGWLTTVQI